MRQLKLTLTIPERALSRKQRARSSSAWLSVLLVGAVLWLVSGGELDPGQVDFGAVSYGTAVQKQLKLTNRGFRDLPIARFSVEQDAQEFTVVADECKDLPASNVCTIDVTFHSGDPGAKRARLVVETASGQRLISDLTAISLPDIVTVTPEFLAFGDVFTGSTSAEQIVSVSGAPGLTLTAASAEGDGYIARQRGCENLAGTTICKVAVQFQSGTTAGERAGVLDVSDNRSGIQHKVPLTANGTAPAPVQVLDLNAGGKSSASGEDLGNKQAQTPPTPPPVQQPPPSAPAPPAPATVAPPVMRVIPSVLQFEVDSAAQDVEVSNVGGPGLTVNAVLKGKSASSYEIVDNRCANPLRSDESCRISVRFAPGAVRFRSSYTAELHITPGSTQAILNQMVANDVALVGRNRPGSGWQLPQFPPPSSSVPTAPQQGTPSQPQPNPQPQPRPHVTITPAEPDLSPPHIRQLITIMNDGKVPLQAIQLQLKGPQSSSFSLTDSNCAGLAVGQSCRVLAVFIARSTVGQFNAVLSVLGGAQQLGTANLHATVAPSIKGAITMKGANTIYRPKPAPSNTPPPIQ
ncbi:choice-of-anchor D domain-containing protein [Occallatibacter riparius]|uniref:Choice-of-anchor D domain-containing protein n=1 Tax=Occallatibacter riparius TaxID=1002689 RepID=A0A9J7BQ24_9BACT|nr:choice-of-anchor D domain-containing protein [Occallatibacter riparius]UWZ84695.1 choice-of-anchor D domain-containing protein [Occallatibacter riparius]